MTSTKDDVNLFDAGKDLSSAVGMLVRWWWFRWDWWLDLLALVLVYSVVASPVEGDQWRVVPQWPGASATLVVFITLFVCLVVWRRRGPAQGWYGMWRGKRDRERERNTFARVVRELDIKGRDGLLGVGDPYPRLRGVRATDGVVTGRVELPPGLKDGMVGFLKRRDDIAGAYPDDRRHGPIEKLLLFPCQVNASRHANLVLIRTPLRPLPALSFDEVPAAAAQSYRLGAGFYGDVRWDLVDDPHASFNGPTRPLAVDTPIPTPSGWSTMGELRVGDEVFDDAGRPTKVVGVSPVYEGRPCFELVFDDGATIVADAEHNWVTWDFAARNNETYRLRKGKNQWRDPGPKVRSTAELAATIQAAGMGAAPRKNHSIPVAGPLDLPDADLPIDPYVLGVWLGDGFSNSGSFVGIDPEIADEVRMAGYTVARHPHHSNASRWLVSYDERFARAKESAVELVAGGMCHRHAALRCGVNPDTFRAHLAAQGIATAESVCTGASGACGRGSRGCVHARDAYPQRVPRGLQAELRSLGVLGCKRIPALYLRASFKQRLALLQGLMDTDGTCGARGNPELGLSNLELMRDARELVLSLGHKVGPIGSRRTRLGGDAYRIVWSAPDPVFRLPRKLERQKLSGFKPWVTTHRYLADVRPVESVPVRCITVEAASHLFLAGEAMIPTHNSGKGNLARYVALQALHAGQQVDVIDGTGSHEWAPLLEFEGLFRWRPYEMKDGEFYSWADGVLDDLGWDMVARNRLIGEAGFDNFTQAAKAGRVGGLRRRLLIVDEASTTLTTASSDKRVKELVASVAGKVDAVAKTAAKAGGHLVVLDQLSYQGQVGLASATRAQLGRWVATGPIPNEMKPSVSGLPSWPFDTPEGRGFAATGRRGLSAELLVVPEVGR